MPLQDNAPIPISRRAFEKIRELGFASLIHSPPSPDSAPSDWFVFKKFKVVYILKTFQPLRWSSLALNHALTLSHNVGFTRA